MPRSKGSPGREKEDVANSDDHKGKQISRRIEKQLEKDRKQYLSIHRLLLLGAGESGKSTIAKQMRILHVGGFSDSDREEKKQQVKRNVLESLLSITRAMSRLRPPLKLEYVENETRVRYLHEVATQPGYNYPTEFWECAKALWQDRGVQSCFYRSSEYQLIDCAKYFLDKVDEIQQPSYTPTDQDILWCRVRTSGVFETRFSVDRAQFLMVDVGGQRDERKKWIQCFNDVTAIIFVSACSAFDQMLLEEESKNRLEESLELFKFIWNHKWLDKVSVILFLNKEDLLLQKITAGVKIEKYFKEYASFKPTEKSASLDPHQQEFEKVKGFIKSKFEEVTARGVRGSHRLYPYFTCAVDTQNVRRVFNTCKGIIQQEHLRQMGVLH